MGASVMIADVRMAAGATQPDRRHSGETIITVLAGAASIRQGELRTDLVEGDVVVVPGDVTYSVVAGPAGCARWDVYSPPDVALAEEAFHQEHATHGFE
jgi:quercetin dioxygenase-like cupin family protein